MGIYLDSHTASRPFPSSIERMHALFKTAWGSLSAPHQIGQDALSVANTSLQIIYDFLGAGEKDIFTFTSSGSEAISQVFLSTYTDLVRENGKNHFMTTTLEGASIFHSLERLEKLGCVSKKLPVSSRGQLTKEILQEAIRPRSALLSLSWANSLTGVINPIHDLAEVCKEKEVKFHVDAGSVLGKLFFRFQDLGVDYLTFDGDILHAPKGTGGLLQKESSFLSRLVVGDPDCSAPAIGGLATSFTLLQEHFDHVCMETARLRDRLEQGILDGFPEATVFFANVERLPNTAVIAFPGIFNEALLYALHRKGVYASIGGNRSQKIAEILQACGVSKELASTSICFSLSYETTQKNIDDAIAIILDAAKNLSRTSKGFFEVPHG